MFLRSKARPVRRTDNLTAICEPSGCTMMDSQHFTRLRLPCYGDSFYFVFYTAYFSKVRWTRNHSCENLKSHTEHKVVSLIRCIHSLQGANFSKLTYSARNFQTTRIMHVTETLSFEYQEETTKLSSEGHTASSRCLKLWSTKWFEAINVKHKSYLSENILSLSLLHSLYCFCSFVRCVFFQHCVLFCVICVSLYVECYCSNTPTG
jgi:hypothetical protein